MRHRVRSRERERDEGEVSQRELMAQEVEGGDFCCMDDISHLIADSVVASDMLEVMRPTGNSSMPMKRSKERREWRCQCARILNAGRGHRRPQSAFHNRTSQSQPNCSCFNDKLITQARNKLKATYT